MAGKNDPAIDTCGSFAALQLRQDDKRVRVGLGRMPLQPMAGWVQVLGTLDVGLTCAQVPGGCW